jgi:hypothetical protein
MENTTVVLRLALGGEQTPYLSDISSLLYDFELSYNLSVILTAPEYADYVFSDNFFFRTRRKLKDEYRIRVSKITKESPFEILLVIASGAVAVTAILKALDVLLDVIEKASTLGSKREKGRLENENLKKDGILKDLEIEKQLQKRKAKSIRDSLVKRIQKNPMQIVKFEIQVIDDKSKEVVKTQVWRSSIDEEKKRP